MKTEKRLTTRVSKTGSPELPDIRDLYFEHDGEIIKLRGRDHRIKYESFNAVFPYKHVSVHVSLIPVNTNSKWYRDMYDKLGGDWLTDGLTLDGAAYVSVYKQLMNKKVK